MFPGAQVTVLDEHTTLLVEERRFSWGHANGFWLVVDGAPVAYLHTAMRPDRPYPFTICDVEVREDFRSKGYGRAIVAAAEGHQGATLYGKGSYTPLGKQASLVPIIPGYEYDAGVKFDDMPFVKDWDTFTPFGRL